MNFSPDAQPLVAWSVICLRPSLQQAGVRRAVQARGGRHISLPGLRLVALPATRALDQALSCAAVVFTSPAAVHFAARQQALALASGAQAFAVGEGTRKALAGHHIAAISPPPDAMHSDGVLALPQWASVKGPVGLVTAPGGRGIIAAGLVQRGLVVVRANVYQRVPPRVDRRHLSALAQSTSPRAVLISSAEALDNLLAALPAEMQSTLLDAVAVVCSPRLGALATAHGFRRVVIASDPTAATMLNALEQHASEARFR